MKAREVNKRIESLGGIVTRRRGSHRRYTVTAPDGTDYHTTVPQHSGDVPAGTLAAIARDLAPALGKGWLR